MKNLLIVLWTLISFFTFGQIEKPAILLSQIEMTPSGGQAYDEFYWFNSNNANLSQSVSFPATGSYRFDLSAYKTAGNPSIIVLIDGTSKGTINITNTNIAIYSLFINSISAGTHTVVIQLNNFSSGTNHCRVGLLYFTQTNLSTPYVYPAITPLALVPGQVLQANHFGSGHLRGFSLGSNGTNQPTENANSMIAMKATGANIARCFVEIERLSGDTYTFKSGELIKLDTTLAQAKRLGFYVVPVLFHDPSLNSDYWGTSASHIARRASIVTLWQTLAKKYNGNATIAAYDLINEPRSNFNYAEVIRWQTDMISAIRAIDASHVIAVECIENDMFAMMLPLGYTNIIYSPHGYSPINITHQGVAGEPGANVRNKYPTITPTANQGVFGKKELSAQHDDVRILAHRFHVAIFIGEFSCVNWAPLNDNGEWSSTKWVDDNISLLEAEGWSWVYHNWSRGGEAIEWDPEIPSSYYNSVSFTSAMPSSKPSKSAESSTAPTIVMLKKWFGLNDSSTAVGNSAPTVSITSPVANASFAAPASIVVSAAASDADGSISKVEFYNGNTLLSSDNSSPYSFTWNNVAVGNYTITAKATDNSGAVTTSSSIVVAVSTPNTAPTVSITSPVANATFDAPASITVSAAASDTDGSISKVEFYNGNTLLGSDNSSPYNFTWNNVAAGSYTITAKATDNSGAVTSSSSIVVAVSTPNAAPTVSITSPVANATFDAPASVIISAVASDADGSISKVEFYNDDTLVTTEYYTPYSWPWQNLAKGTYTITAKAYDNSGTFTISSPVVVSVSTPNTAPIVSITSPVANATFDAPASITVSAAASDADGSISKVEFYNGNTLLGSDNSSPYSFTWNNVAAGSYTITAKATDNSGAVTSSSSSIVVAVSTPNATPTVSITSPVANATFDAPASIVVSAAASDADGSISKVEFYNGNTLLSSDNSSPYSFTWNNVAVGNYTITAKATDNSGAVTTSSSIVVAVSTPNTAPTVSITSPVANATFDAPASITVSAAASDTDGSISKVEFYNGNTLLGSDNSSPYNFTWNNVAAGSYTITAKATDNSGAVTSSSSIVVAVSTPNAAPTVSITSPVANATFDAPASITVSAAASDTDGSISKVEFYNGNTLLGSDNSSPYSFSWNNVAVGSYTITAKATDNSSVVTTSSSIVVTVSSSDIAPTISIISPVSNASYDSAQSITLQAAASDTDGTVVKVDFYNGDILLGTKSTSPYTFTWDKVAPGSYSFKAKAYDNKGAATVSTTVPVLVSSPTAFAFISFNGTASLGANQLAWSTTNCKNTSYFRILRGQRRMSMKQIGKVNYLNSGLSSLDYTFTDSSPYSGTNYYKIAEVDNAGKVISSSIITVSTTGTRLMTAVSMIGSNISATIPDGLQKEVAGNSETIKIKIGPSPASNILSVMINGIEANKKIQISILSINGILLKSVNANTPKPVVRMDVSSLIPGIYLVQVVSGEKTVNKQFVKQ